MSESDRRDRDWPRGFDAHRLEQLRRLAALPLWAKLEWLEEAQQVADRLRNPTPSDEEDAGPDQF